MSKININSEGWIKPETPNSLRRRHRQRCSAADKDDTDKLRHIVVSIGKSRNVEGCGDDPGGRQPTTDVIKHNSTDDFDRVPGGPLMDESVMYKPVRKKEERAKLDGWDCDLCRQYYKGLEADMDPSELQRLKNNCSRHRSSRPMNQSFTPPDAWRTTLPDTEEILSRGLIKIGLASPPVRKKRHDLLD